MLTGRGVASLGTLKTAHFSMLAHQLHAAALGAAGDDPRLSRAHLVVVGGE